MQNYLGDRFIHIPTIHSRLFVIAEVLRKLYFNFSWKYRKIVNICVSGILDAGLQLKFVPWLFTFIHGILGFSGKCSATVYMRISASSVLVPFVDWSNHASCSSVTRPPGKKFKCRCKKYILREVLHSSSSVSLQKLINQLRMVWVIEDCLKELCHCFKSIPSSSLWIVSSCIRSVISNQVSDLRTNKYVLLYFFSFIYWSFCLKFPDKIFLQFKFNVKRRQADFVTTRRLPRSKTCLCG
jgi:hypothetical protein